jgi:hypothetical protein
MESSMFWDKETRKLHILLLTYSYIFYSSNTTTPFSLFCSSLLSQLHPCNFCMCTYNIHHCSTYCYSSIQLETICYHLALELNTQSDVQTIKSWNEISIRSRLHFKCDGTRTETRFRLSAKQTSPFKSAGASVQSTTGSWDVRISGSNAGYTIFWGSVKSTGYPLHSPVSPSLPLLCVTVCHHISTGVYIWCSEYQTIWWVYLMLGTKR